MNRKARRANAKSKSPAEPKQLQAQLQAKVIVEGKKYVAPVFMRRWLEAASEAYKAAREQGLDQSFTEYLEALSHEPANAVAIRKQATL